MTERVRTTAKKTEAKKEASVSRTQKTDLSRSMNSPADQILFLQRTIGNQAVQRLIRSGALQAKLAIGKICDIYEQGADRMAEQVLRMPDPGVQRQAEEEEEEELIQTKSIAEQVTPLVQRQVEAEEEKELQTKAIPGKTPEVTDDLQTRLNQSKGSGQPLSGETMTFMESRFGVDFSGVRVNTDTKASDLARALNAQAFTMGRVA